jgi:hypothetical protein
MPFYLYGTGQEMHIDHILVRAPNAQLSAGEVTVELIEGSESVFAAGLRNGFIAVADALPEHLMQPFTLGRLESFFYPGAKLDLSLYPDDDSESRGYEYDLCDKLGEPIARSRITLGGNTFVDEYMINLDVPHCDELPKKGMENTSGSSPPEATFATSQDHPLFRGCAPKSERTVDRHPQSWRGVWDRALAGRRFEPDGINSNSSFSSDESMGSSDTESDDNYSRVLWRDVHQI